MWDEERERSLYGYVPVVRMVNEWMKTGHKEFDYYGRKLLHIIGDDLIVGRAVVPVAKKLFGSRVKRLFVLCIRKDCLPGMEV